MFRLSLIYMRLISYVWVGSQIWAQTLDFCFYHIKHNSSFYCCKKFENNCNPQCIQNFPIKSHLHATHFLRMSRIPDFGTGFRNGFINLTISNTTAYSAVVKCFYIKCNLQYIQNFPIKSHLHATHFLRISRIPDLGTNIGCVHSFYHIKHNSLLYCCKKS